MAIEENPTGTSTENKNDFGQATSAPNSSPATESSDNSSLKQTIKDTAGSAAGQVKDKAATAIDEQKSKVAVGLSSVADELRKAGGNLRDSEGDGVSRDFVKRVFFFLFCFSMPNSQTSSHFDLISPH